jgi:hypothetical protein
MLITITNSCTIIVTVIVVIAKELYKNKVDLWNICKNCFKVQRGNDERGANAIRGTLNGNKTPLLIRCLWISSSNAPHYFFRMTSCYSIIWYMTAQCGLDLRWRTERKILHCGLVSLKCVIWVILDFTRERCCTGKTWDNKGFYTTTHPLQGHFN